MPSRCSLCGEMDYSDMGDMPCYCQMQAQQQPQPTAEDYCADGGHAYYGDDGPPPHGVGRCWCGSKSYPLGGDQA